MTAVEAIREIIKQCPYLDEFYKGIGVDYLGGNTAYYSIESVPSETVLKKDIVGNTKRQYLFNFASRQAYGEEVRKNLDNIGFYEHFSDWLEQFSDTGKFPELEEGKEAIKIEAITSGYVFDTELSKARYQIQCRFLYYQERKV